MQASSYLHLHFDGDRQHGCDFVARVPNVVSHKIRHERWRTCAPSDATHYKWKSKYGGMDASDLKQLKELEPELSQYKRMYAELGRENDAIKDLIAKML